MGQSFPISIDKKPWLSISLALILLAALCHCGLLEQDKQTAGEQRPTGWATEVLSVTYGTDAGFGQGEFPQVVLGPPTGDGLQASSLDVLSLGNGGTITIGFGPDACVIDGQGDDLAVFENVFYVAGDENNRFIETARVAVSQDGNEFVEFPTQVRDDLPVGHPDRYIGFAGVQPTLSGSSPADDGGDRFDLSQIGITWARYVRITDTSGDPRDPGDEVAEGYGQGGFDLDAVGAINLGLGSQCSQ